MKLYLLILFTLLAFNSSISKKKSLQIGDSIPSFTLIDGQGEEFNSSDYFGKQPLVIFFYPKDDAPICTAEVCSFRDSFDDFKKLNAKIVGISTDNTISHRKFSKKNNLPYILLSDHSNRIQKLFGVKKGFLGMMPERVTFIANKQGKIISIFRNHKEAQLHTSEALKALTPSKHGKSLKN